MSLNKDRSIVELVESLHIDEKGWSIQDHWDSDLCAIGIASRAQPDRLVYVSTFDLPAGQYFYECEVENGDRDLPSVVTESASGVGLGILEKKMIEHLGVNSTPKPRRHKSVR